MSLSAQGLAFIGQNEGFVGHVYNDALGNPTIGYGHLIKRGEKFTTISRAQGLLLLEKDASYAVNAVNGHVNVPLEQSEFDALVDFAFNVGNGAFERSTLLMEINAYDTSASTISTQLLRWTNGGLLTGRRNAEINLFNNGTY